MASRLLGPRFGSWLTTRSRLALRAARRWTRRIPHRLAALVALVTAALVASVLSVVALSGETNEPFVPLEPTGAQVDTEIDPLDPMARPKAAKGVELDAPEQLEDDSYTLPEVDPEQVCEDIEGDYDAPAQGALPDAMDDALSVSEKFCYFPESSQSNDLIDSPPLQLADGSVPAPDPGPADPQDDPTPSADPSTDPSGDPSSVPSDVPSDGSSGDPSGSPSPQPSGGATGTDQPSGAASDDASPGSERRGHGMGGRSRVALEPAVASSAAVEGDGEFLSPNWVEQTPTQKPSARDNMAMAYDDTRNEFVLFGGRNASDTYNNQTWTWNGTNWIQETPGTSPSARTRMAMAWDPSSQRVLMFGGQISDFNPLSEVWAWNGSTWTQLAPTGTGPSARTGAAMAYDPTRQGMVVFGGRSATDDMNDTWLLKNNAWTLIQAAGASGAPARRYDVQMAYSNSTSQLVLFGGTTGPCSVSCTIRNDTWLLEPGDTSWTGVNPDHDPPVRTRAQITYNPTLGMVKDAAATPVTANDKGALVMFGGFRYNSATSTSYVMGDTWAWTGEDWLEAKGIAKPVDRAATAMAANDQGQMVMFGGRGGIDYDETWTYDTRFPVLKIEVERESPDTTDAGIYWAGDKIRIRIRAANVSVVASIDTSAQASIVSALQNTVLAAGTGFVGGNPDAPSGNPEEVGPLGVCGLVTTLCGSVKDLAATIGNLTIPIGQTRLGEFLGTIAGSQKGCQIINIPAVAATLLGSGGVVSTPITVCGGGLGMEDWWSYDTTDLGGGGTASVNVANGNLVVKQYDTDPIQTPGHLAIGLGRVYNSQDLMTGAGPIGAGWQFDIGSTGEFAGGFGLGGLRLLNLQTLLNPLSMPYIDRDGTRHAFKLRSIGVALGGPAGLNLPIDLKAPGNAILNLLNPATLPFKLSLGAGDPDDDPAKPEKRYAGLCIDQAYDGPPGSNMFLFRYVGINSACNTGGPDNNKLTIGWSLVRPDRLRYDFDVLGNLVQVTDPAGQVLEYRRPVLPPGGPNLVIRSGSCTDTTAASACPSVKVWNDTDPLSANRLMRVEDSARRTTTYVISRSATLPLLLEVWEPGNRHSTTAGAMPTAAYTYRTVGKKCDGITNDIKATTRVLCSVTDANGETTKFEYDHAPIGPDRIVNVRDRRSSATDGLTNGLATKYTYRDKPGPGQEPDAEVKTGGIDMVYADMAAPNTLNSCGTSCHRIRYGNIDDWGRVGEISKGTTGGTGGNGVYHAQTGYLWDGMAANGGIASCAQPTVTMNHNLCQVIKRANPSEDLFVPNEVETATLNGVTVHDQAVDYLYGDLGQRLRQRVLLDASQTWTNANSAITTWGSRQQYFDANGNQRYFNNHVRGNGIVKSTASDDTYRQAVNADNPVAYWRMDEASATTMANTAPGASGNNGTYASNAVLGQPGIIQGNKAVGTSPTTATAGVSTLTGFAHGTSAADSDFTIETWMKTAQTGVEHSFQWGSSANTFARVGRLAGGLPYVQLVSDFSTGKQIVVHSETPVADNEWHHVVFRYTGTGTAAGVSIWIDGVKQTNTVTSLNTLNGAFAPASTAATVALSAGPATIDEVALYNKALADERINTHHSVGFGANPVKADTLYAVVDEVQELSPRGNEPGNADKWGSYLTSIRRDVPADGQLISTNKVPGNSGTGPAVCGDAQVGNTGLVCEIDTPAAKDVNLGVCRASTAAMPTGSPAAPIGSNYASTCTTYEYNAQGQRTLMRTPKANAGSTTSNLQAAYRYRYYPIVANCSGENRKACDLSGTVSAGGWLKAVIDPADKKVIHAYDAAGNIARTWDRNATDGKDLDAAWADPTATPSTKFTDTVSANPVTSDALSVSNTALIAIQPDGTVTGAGTNASGELGNGTTSAQGTAVRAEPLTNVVQVAQSSTGSFSGCAFTLTLTGSGEVWSTGSGISTPTKVAGLSNIISIAAGGCHALALDAEGNLWAWGINNYGQVGNGTTTNVTTPVKVLEKVSTIAAGYLHSLAVTTDGRVHSWGLNNTGQLGHGDTTNRTTPTHVQAFGTGSTGAGIRQLSGGFASSYAVGRDGRVWAFGNNTQSDLGDGTTTNRTSPVRLTTLGPGTTAGPVRQVVGAAYGAVALMADGTVWTWGVNNSGQSGGGSAAATMPSPVKVPNLSGQVAVAGGWATIATADQAGRIKVWGATSGRQLANGSTAPPATTTTPTTAQITISPYKTALWGAQGTRDATGNLTTITRDKLGQPRRTRTGRGHDINTSAFDRMVGYDAAGRPTWTSGAQHRSTASIARTTYDPYGSPIKTIDARGIASRATFDSLNRQLTKQVTRGVPADAPASCSTTATTSDWTAGQNGHRICTSSATYSATGLQVTTADANSQVTKYHFDAAGRQVRVDTPRTPTTAVVTRWNYDRDGNVLDNCPPRQHTSSDPVCGTNGRFSTHATYDPAGNVTAETKFREITDGFTTLTTAYKYDADRNAVSVTDAEGHETTTTYDLLDRRTAQTVPRSASKSYTTGWNYDASGNVTAVRAPGSINTGSGADGHLVIDGTTAANSTDGIAHGAANPFQVPDGAQYRNVTLQNGARITSAAANGLMLHASGTVTICSTCAVVMTGKGYTGGAAGTGANAGNGSDAANPNPGNGGKGGLGGGALNPSGGGGGGHKTDGGNAGTAGAGPGQPGKASGAPDFAIVGTDYLRGSGGGGGGGGKNLLGTAGKGGNGGGYVRITANKIIVNGPIDASGADGTAGVGSSGGGGGGAGGGIWLAAPDIDLGSTTVLDVTGGTGGTATVNRQGGNGADGYIRIDADTVTNEPSGADRTRAAMITAISYDAANRPLDTIEGAQTVQADPTLDAGEFAVPDPNGLANTRTRSIYDADGKAIAVLPPQAFGNAASLTAPKVDTARRIDYDLDGLPIASYTPRFDNSTSGQPNGGTSSIGSGNDGGSSGNQQVDQCTTNRVIDQPAGQVNVASSQTVLPVTYASQVGVCVTRSTYDPVGRVKTAWLPNANGGANAADGYLEYTYTADGLVGIVTGPDPNSTGRVTMAKARYDGVGRSVRVIDANFNYTQTGYTSDGLVAETIGMAYDPDGPRDPDGPDGPAEPEGPNGPLAALNEITVFAYDANGNLTMTTDPKGEVTTQLWTSDNLLQQIDAPGPSSTPARTKYAYDKVGNPTQTWTPKAEELGWGPVRNEFTFDNKIAATHTPITGSSFRTVRYAYSPAGLKTATHTARCTSGDWMQCVPGNPAFDGNPVGANTAGVVKLTYGANGRPASQVGRDTTPAEGPSASITTTYTQQGGPAKIIDPTSGITTEVGYYLDGTTRRVSESGTGLDGQGNTTTYAYDAAGALSVRTDLTSAGGVTDGNPVITSYRYNHAGLPAATNSDILTTSTNYTWDDGGRLIRAQTGGHNEAPQVLRRSYAGCGSRLRAA